MITLDYTLNHYILYTTVFDYDNTWLYYETLHFVYYRTWLPKKKGFDNTTRYYTLDITWLQDILLYYLKDYILYTKLIIPGDYILYTTRLQKILLYYVDDYILYTTPLQNF